MTLLSPGCPGSAGLQADRRGGRQSRHAGQAGRPPLYLKCMSMITRCISRTAMSAIMWKPLSLGCL